jgi:GT2 family glycosyltransferase
MPTPPGWTEAHPTVRPCLQEYMKPPDFTISIRGSPRLRMKSRFSGNPFVSVIVPVYNDWNHLPRCLEALKSQTYPTDHFEVIVVNNEASPEPKMEIDGERILVLHEPRAGSYHARNLGVQHARGEILAFTDADCIPENHWIEVAIRCFMEHAEICRVAGPVSIIIDENRPSPVELYELLFAFPQEKYATRFGTAVTGNMFSLKKVFSDVGLFQGEAKSGEDVRWGKRAQQAGYQIYYDPQVKVAHPANKRWAEIAGRAKRIYGGQWINGLRDHPSPLNGWIVLKGLKDDLRKIFVVMRSNQLRAVGQRVKVILVVVYIRFIRLQEHLRLLIGGEQRRA